MPSRLRFPSPRDIAHANIAPGFYPIPFLFFPKFSPRAGLSSRGTSDPRRAAVREIGGNKIGPPGPIGLAAGGGRRPRAGPAGRPPTVPWAPTRACWRVRRGIKGFNEIMDGKHDNLPEAAFNLVGTIEQAVEKGEKILAEVA